MDDQESISLIPQYPVRIWEVILIALGAIGLVGVAGLGLGIKAINNAFDPQRAEIVAKSLMDYDIPQGSEGVFGIKIGGAKFAWVRSKTKPPDVTLFVGTTPITKETDESDKRALWEYFQNPPSDQVQEQFTAMATRSEYKTLCGQTVPVTIEAGQQGFSNQPTSMPAIRYTASVVMDETERLVILTTNGQNAEAKAAQVFNSLNCK